MDGFMPSEIARLVLGYLKETGCIESWKVFLNECPDLKEYAQCYKRGREYPTRINGQNLIEILEDYASSPSQEGSENTSRESSVIRSCTSDSSHYRGSSCHIQDKTRVQVSKRHSTNTLPPHSLKQVPYHSSSNNSHGPNSAHGHQNKRPHQNSADPRLCEDALEYCESLESHSSSTCELPCNPSASFGDDDPMESRPAVPVCNVPSQPASRVKDNVFPFQHFADSQNNRADSNSSLYSNHLHGNASCPLPLSRHEQSMQHKTSHQRSVKTFSDITGNQSNFSFINSHHHFSQVVQNPAKHASNKGSTYRQTDSIHEQPVQGPSKRDAAANQEISQTPRNCRRKQDLTAAQLPSDDEICVVSVQHGSQTTYSTTSKTSRSPIQSTHSAQRTTEEPTANSLPHFNVPKQTLVNGSQNVSQTTAPENMAPSATQQESAYRPGFDKFQSVLHNNEQNVPEEKSESRLTTSKDTHEQDVAVLMTPKHPTHSLGYQSGLDRGTSFCTPGKDVFVDEDSRSPRRKSHLPRRRLVSSASPSQSTGPQISETELAPHAEDSVDLGIILDELINFPALHEKIAENINKVVLNDRKPGAEGSNTSESKNLEAPSSPQEIHVPDNVIKDIVIRTTKEPVFEEVVNLLCGKYDSSRDSTDVTPYKQCSSQMDFTSFSHSHYEAITPPSRSTSSTPAHITPSAEETATPSTIVEHPQSTELTQTPITNEMSGEHDRSGDQENQVAHCSPTAQAVNTDACSHLSQTEQSQKTSGCLPNDNHFPANICGGLQQISQTSQNAPSQSQAKLDHGIQVDVTDLCSETSRTLDINVPTVETATSVVATSGSLPPTQVVFTPSTVQPSRPEESIILNSTSNHTVSMPQYVCLDGFINLNSSGLTSVPSNFVISSVGNVTDSNPLLVAPTVTPMKFSVPDFQVLTLTPGKIFGMPSTLPLDAEILSHKPIVPLPPHTTIISTFPEKSLAQPSLSGGSLPMQLQSASTVNPPPIKPAPVQTCRPILKRKVLPKSTHPMNHVSNFPKLHLKNLFPNTVVTRSVSESHMDNKQLEQTDVQQATDTFTRIQESRETSTAPNGEDNSSGGISQSPRSSRLQSLVNTACMLATKEQNKENHVRALDFCSVEVSATSSQPISCSSHSLRKDEANPTQLQSGGIKRQSNNETTRSVVTKVSDGKDQQNDCNEEVSRGKKARRVNGGEYDVSKTLVSLAKGGAAFIQSSPEGKADVSSTCDNKLRRQKRKQAHKKKADLVKLDVDKFLDQVHSST